MPVQGTVQLSANAAGVIRSVDAGRRTSHCRAIVVWFCAPGFQSFLALGWPMSALAGRGQWRVAADWPAIQIEGFVAPFAK